MMVLILVLAGIFAIKLSQEGYEQVGVIQWSMCPSKDNQVERNPPMWTYAILIWLLSLLRNIGLVASLFVVYDAFANKLPQQWYKHDEMNQQISHYNYEMYHKIVKLVYNYPELDRDYKACHPWICWV